MIPVPGQIHPLFLQRNASQPSRDIPSFLRVERKVCPTTSCPIELLSPSFKKRRKRLKTWPYESEPTECYRDNSYYIVPLHLSTEMTSKLYEFLVLICYNVQQSLKPFWSSCVAKTYFTSNLRLMVHATPFPHYLRQASCLTWHSPNLYSIPVYNSLGIKNL